MKKNIVIAALLLLSICACRFALAQTPVPQTIDSLGAHNMTVGSGSTLTTNGSLGCTFCHAPHSGIGGISPLWNQQLSAQTYTPYTSSTYKQTGNANPVLGVTSSLCLSCHDGTVAVGQTAAYGKIPMSGNAMNGTDILGTSLVGSHPFSLVLPMQDAPDLVSTLVQGVTADPLKAVKLVNGNIECTTCHNPHVQGIDNVAQDFLVRDASNGQLCLACHDPNRTMSNQTNLLTGWTGSIHQTATNQVSVDANVGPYITVGVNACASCHMEHNKLGYARLVRPATPATTGVDPSTQDCITCHNGGNLVSPGAPNVYAEFAKISHPLPSGSNTHDEAEPAVLNGNRHATCVDCHSPHASKQMATFTNPPAIRATQNYATGVSATDGRTAVWPAVNQYETCFRCHGTSTGKQVPIKYGYLPTRLVFSGDPLNLVGQFSPSATSAHPVVQPSNSSLPQPSLLKTMLNINGTASGRVMGSQIFCTDCHASDDNREFGGTGPAGPHGSLYSHILERNYQFSQAIIPGGTVTNTYPSPDTSTQGPYALCAKCHDLNNILSNASWSQHNLHVSTSGFSCSVCHTAHGMGAVNPTVSGERLINFDIAVVGQNNGAPISYNRTSNTCTLTCHNAAHNANGSVTVNGTTLPQLAAPRH